jgi:hypothetical protein
MNLLTEAMNALGAAVLPVVAALLLVELTYGGLVRLLVVPWPGTGKRGDRDEGRTATTQSLKRRLRRRIKLNKRTNLTGCGESPNR